MANIPHRLQHQVSGSQGPCAIYLPGVHGDWTPFHRVRPLLAAHLRIVEISYPGGDSWSLDSLAGEIESLMGSLGIARAHFIAESFGSLVGLNFALNRSGKTESLISVGGFTRALPHSRAYLAGLGLRGLPTRLLELGIDSYVFVKNLTHEKRPPPAEGLAPYFSLRSQSGHQSLIRRMEIIHSSDFRDQIGKVRAPLRYLAGRNDRIVPVVEESKVLREALDGRADFQSLLVPGAPHMIMVANPAESAEALLNWIFDIEKRRAADRSAENVGSIDG